MCRPAPDASRAAAARPAESCRPGERLEPYDPGRAEAGGRPGAIRLGRDTEVRIGGRVRAEYDVRR